MVEPNVDEAEDRFYQLAREGKFNQAVRHLTEHPHLAANQYVFYSAAGSYPASILSKIIELGADVNQLDQMGYTALTYAVRRCNLVNVRLLLEHGADPNLGNSITNTVNSRAEKDPIRKDILKLMVEYGADINQRIPTLRGYNLLIKAMECCDDEMVELIEAYGGRPTQEYLDALEREPIELNIDTFEDRLVAALRTAWSEVIASRPGETFFMFGIETDDDRCVLTPYCNTEEVAQQENAEIQSFPAAKWAVMPDFSLYGAGKEHTEPLATELNSGSFHNWTKKKQKRITEIFENALVRLDKKGLIGKGVAREKVIIGVAIIDADQKAEKEMLRIMKRINPPGSMTPLLDALKKR